MTDRVDAAMMARVDQLLTRDGEAWIPLLLERDEYADGVVSDLRALVAAVRGLEAELAALREAFDNLSTLQQADRAEVLSLRAENAALREDAKRLDWLDKENDGTVAPLAALVVKRNHIRDSSEWANICTPIRAALDTARGEG